MINITESICSICLFPQNTSITLKNCDHTFCHSCINNHLQALIDQGCRRLEHFKCPNEQCQQQINESELEKYIDFEYFNKLTNKKMYQYSILCPECRTRIDIIQNPDTWKCFNCYTMICKFCKATDHDGKCQTQTSYLNEELGYCPSCLTPFLKDQNCDRVKCELPECGFQFCFFCSASFSPIDNHGSIYHRTDCRNYQHWAQFQPYYYDQCTQCKKTGNDKGCPLPTQTKQQFFKQISHRAQQKTNYNKDM